ncbi:hypothetical protein ACFYP4_02280 [Streptomyces sp. NPDC005551]|uniref:hypothetical protein n=1 Tax=Streptomyces sp. NPDC005551 TaxID=3364725 RepID=UPI00367CC29B
MKVSKRWENPRLLPEMQHAQIEWLNNKGGIFWIQSASDGTFFYVPPEVRTTAKPLADKFLKKRRQSGEVVSREMLNEHFFQAEIFTLADWVASSWDNAKLYSVTPAMTMKAARTGMTEFFLPSSLLPADSGVIFWQRPIGATEHFNPTTRYEIDPETGVPSVISYYSLYNLVMDDKTVPVVGASWKKMDDGRLYVAFWSDTESMVATLKNITDPQRRQSLAALAPVMLEREQVLPLDEKVPWFTSDKEDRLVPTARGRGKDSRTMILARERKFQGLPMLEQMVRTFTATLLYMRHAQDERDVVYAPKSTAKRMRQAGAPERIASNAVRIVKMGEPLRYRPPKRKEDAAWHWEERRVIEPYIRYTQYVPATGERREGIFEVSGYIAGPPGAPIRNIDKVFLLGGDE